MAQLQPNDLPEVWARFPQLLGHFVGNGKLCRYMMVDSEEDKKTHRPLAPKEAPKKLVRYIDNQVVTTKGERYKDVKKPESEEMKKTYINLKPARKYKFH